MERSVELLKMGDLSAFDSLQKEIRRRNLKEELSDISHVVKTGSYVFSNKIRNLIKEHNDFILNYVKLLADTFKYVHVNLPLFGDPYHTSSKGIENTYYPVSINFEPCDIEKENLISDPGPDPRHVWMKFNIELDFSFENNKGLLSDDNFKILLTKELTHKPYTSSKNNKLAFHKRFGDIKTYINKTHKVNLVY
jgi:hypothetical protein